MCRYHLNYISILVIFLSDKYKDVQSDFLTKVPSVYFCSNDSYALKCQITVNSLFAQQTSRLLSIYGAMDETARKLGVAFRFWSKVSIYDFNFAS